MKVFIIGDTHFPFTCEKSLKKVYKLIKSEQPDAVIQIGDILDQYVFSSYSRSLEITPKDEIERGLYAARAMWHKVREIVPKAKCYQILGNHDLRMSKRIYAKLPELADMFTLNDLYKFKGVTVSKSDRDILILDDVYYVHGFLSQSFAHAKYFNNPVVHGHCHRPTIVAEGPRLWSMDVGFIADQDSVPLSYTSTRFSRWRHACGIVEDGLPRLILL